MLTLEEPPSCANIHQHWLDVHFQSWLLGSFDCRLCCRKKLVNPLSSSSSPLCLGEQDHKNVLLYFLFNFERRRRIEKFFTAVIPWPKCCGFSPPPSLPPPLDATFLLFLPLDVMTKSFFFTWGRRKKKTFFFIFSPSLGLFSSAKLWGEGKRNGFHISAQEEVTTTTTMNE